jgi:hypothetical protein
VVYNWETYKQPTNKFFHQPQFGPTTPIIPPKLSNFSWKPLKQTLPYLVLSHVVSGWDVKWSWWSTPNTHWNSGALESPKTFNILCQWNEWGVVSLASPSLMVEVLKRTSCPKGMHNVVHETPQSTIFLLHASKGKLHPQEFDNLECI